MQLGVMRGRKATPVRMASHWVARVGRPGRLRGRGLMIIQGVLAVVLVVLGRRNYLELERTASALKTYGTTRITDIISQYGSDFRDTRWDDKYIQGIAYKKPKFHLLIPASNATANLCKTLLSAAVLNYPPPTLVSYGGLNQSLTPGLELVRNTYSFLLSREARGDDLVLVVEEDTWFQLPAEVTINRFFNGMQESSYELVNKYGRLPLQNDSVSSPPKYTSKVLFGAVKECSSHMNHPACISPPQSPLPKDIYGPETDKNPEGKYNRPRFMGSSMVMGRVSDLLPIYKHATGMLEGPGKHHQSSQTVFSRIFGEQEYARSLAAPVAPLSRSAKFRAFFPSSTPADNPLGNFTLQPGKNYEFSITLDYFSSIFQTMNNSAEDVHMVSFSHPSVIASPSKLSASAFKNPIHLPWDLNSTSPPFSQYVVSSASPDPPITKLDDMPGSKSKNSWQEVELATNVIVPGSSVPASLNFYSNQGSLNEMWTKMWYHPYARALMRQYIRSPEGPIAAEAARAGGDKWWDLRGGKGGVWTGKGEWLEWNEVCGVYDNEVFGDGKGEFGRESVKDGGQGVQYDKFGNIVSGKLAKGKDEGPKKDKSTVGDKPDDADGENGDVDDNDAVNDNDADAEDKEHKESEEGKKEQEPEPEPEPLSEEEQIRRVAEKIEAEFKAEDLTDADVSEPDVHPHTESEPETEAEGELVLREASKDVLPPDSEPDVELEGVRAVSKDGEEGELGDVGDGGV